MVVVSVSFLLIICAKLCQFFKISLMKRFEKYKNSIAFFKENKKLRKHYKNYCISLYAVYVLYSFRADVFRERQFAWKRSARS